MRGWIIVVLFMYVRVVQTWNVMVAFSPALLSEPSISKLSIPFRWHGWLHKRLAKICQFEGAFQKSELIGWTRAGPVILTMKNAFFQEFLFKHHLLRARYLGFDWSDWIVLIKSEILIMTGMVWPGSSDKWKAPWEYVRLPSSVTMVQIFVQGRKSSVSR